jgi:chromate transport protein ChrA
VERPSLLKLFLSYLRVTNLTFGGGTVTMAALHTELLSLHRWLTQEKYATVYALAGMIERIVAFRGRAGNAAFIWSR